MWGSWRPLSPSLFDITVTRAAAFYKIQKLRRTFQDVLKTCESQKGEIIEDLLAWIKLTDFYFQKLESYFELKARKNVDEEKQLLEGGSDDSSPWD